MFWFFFKSNYNRCILSYVFPTLCSLMYHFLSADINNISPTFYSHKTSSFHCPCSLPFLHSMNIKCY